MESSHRGWPCKEVQCTNAQFHCLQENWKIIGKKKRWKGRTSTFFPKWLVWFHTSFDSSCTHQFLQIKRAHSVSVEYYYQLAQIATYVTREIAFAVFAFWIKRLADLPAFLQMNSVKSCPENAGPKWLKLDPQLVQKNHCIKQKPSASPSQQAAPHKNNTTTATTRHSELSQWLRSTDLEKCLPPHLLSPRKHQHLATARNLLALRTPWGTKKH